jgi:hypothetical protein
VVGAQPDCAPDADHLPADRAVAAQDHGAMREHGIMLVRREALIDEGVGYNLDYVKWPHETCNECNQSHPKRWRPLTITQVADLEADKLVFLWEVFTASVVLVGGADIMIDHLNAIMAKCDPSMFAASEAEARRLAANWSRYQPPTIERHVVVDVDRYDPDPHSDRASCAYTYSSTVVTSIVDRNSYRRGMSDAWSEDARKVAHHLKEAMNARASWQKSVEAFAVEKRHDWRTLNPRAAIMVRDAFAEGARPLGHFDRYWINEIGVIRSIAAAVHRRATARTKDRRS